VKRPVIFPLQSDSAGQENRSACIHLSTAKEMDLFTNKIPLEDKKLLPKFVFTIFGLPMMIMLLKAI
jgi:hypothetical protein